MDGTTTTYKHITLHTADAQIETVDMPWTLKLLNILIDPNLLFLLFLAGIGGIAYEVFHPGVILPGTLGGDRPDPRALRLLGRPDQPRRASRSSCSASRSWPWRGG